MKNHVSSLVDCWQSILRIRQNSLRLAFSVLCLVGLQVIGAESSLKLLIHKTNSAMVLQLQGTAGSSNQIQFTEALKTQSSWQPLTNLVINTNAPWFSDPGAQTVPQRFYRALAIDGSGTNNQSTSKPPVIYIQPWSYIVAPGQDALFSVWAVGSPPLAFQWRSNGTALAGEQGTALTVKNVATNATGRFSVRITNALGVVTSQEALFVSPHQSGPCRGL